MSRYLHTMLRVTDLERSRAFYEALGMEFRRESPIVRNGELEATLYFFGYPGQQEELELTFNHDGRSYELGSGYGHIAIGVSDLDATLAELAAQGIEPERPPYTIREGGSRSLFCRRPGFLPGRDHRAALSASPARMVEPQSVLVDHLDLSGSRVKLLDRVDAK